MSSTVATNAGDLVSAPPSKSGFQSFENAAADAVLAISYNSAGTRYAVASADHKVRIYDIPDPNSGQAVLIDQWRAHDAEILDVQWVPSSFGQYFATTASDNKFKLWREDPSQPPLSGRRFRCIFSQSPANHVSYASFEFYAKNQDIYLALFTHDGLLSLLEPSEPDSLASWREIDQLYPFGKHQRGTEPRFCLSFHQGLAPSSQAVAAGLGTEALSLAVSAANFIKIYRAIRSNVENPVTQATGEYQLQEMLEIEVETAGVNFVAWAPGCLSPYDVIAAACEDGTVRIIEVTIPSSASPPGILTTRKSSLQAVPGAQGKEMQRRASAASSKPPTPSGIGAGLAGMTRGVEGNRRDGGIELKHEWRECASLNHGRGAPCWKVAWMYDGSAVASTGDDGFVALWRRGVDGGWVEFSRTGHST